MFTNYSSLVICLVNCHYDKFVMKATKISFYFVILECCSRGSDVYLFIS